MTGLKALIFLSFLIVVTTKCIKQDDDLLCFNTLRFEDYVLSATSLYLFNSFIDAKTLEEKLPNVNFVYVSGLYVTDTCFELKGKVEIHGCHGTCLNCRDQTKAQG